jgi:signal transduction histidine kinase
MWTWNPFVTYWTSSTDSLAEIELYDINTIGRYNDFGLDQMMFFSIDSAKTPAEPVLYYSNLKPASGIDDYLDVVTAILDEELQYRGVAEKCQIIPIAADSFLKQETNVLQTYSTYARYYEQFYIEDGYLYSAYYRLTPSVICKSKLPNYYVIIWNHLSGQVLLFFVSVIISIMALWFLNRFMKRQEQLSRLKYDITNSITHELKTPVATILAATEALQHHGLIDNREKTDQYLNMTNASAVRLHQLIEKSMNMAAVEEKDFSLQRSEIPINDFFADLAKPALYDQSNSLQIQYSQTSNPVLLTADRFHLSNIIHTLVDNSVKYASGSVEVKLSCKTSKDSIILSVADNGTGIAPRYHKLVFEKFFRVPDDDRYVVKGNGLGLHYVKSIMELHGGNVRVISDGKTGTEIQLIFPIKHKT